MVSLATLNNWMKFWGTGIIVPQEYYWDTLRTELKGGVQTDRFRGDLAEIMMELAYSMTGQAFGENVDIPAGGAMSFVKQFIPLKQVIANAQLTSQAMDRADSEEDAWGPIVDKTLRNLINVDFRWLMELVAAGDGTGRLARTMGTDDSGSPVTAGRIRICCDNTYTDFGWENVALIKPGMQVEIYNAAGTQAADASAVNKWTVTKVWFGSRNNGVAVTPATTDGSEVACFEIACTAGQEATIAAFANDHGLVHIAGSRSLGLGDTAEYFVVGGAASQKCYEVTNYTGTVDLRTPLPMGLAGILQSALANVQGEAGGATVMTLDTFQGLARASYATLNAKIFDADDFGGAEGTPADWGLSTITDAMTEREAATGKYVDLLICSSQLAQAIHRRNRAESSINVTVASTGNQNQAAVGAEIANAFIRPDGKVIPIKISKTCPRNVLKAICREDLRWFVRGGFGFMEPGLSGGTGPWVKTYNDRKANVEAPYGGYEQLAAVRCDTSFEIQDMRDDI